MNALAITATNPLNALLAMSVAPRVSQASGSFSGLADLMFDAPVANKLSAPSQTIADALIRSMMSSPPILATPQVKSAIRSSIVSDREQPIRAASPNAISNAVSNNDAPAEPNASAPLVKEPASPGLNPPKPESTPAPEPQRIDPAALTSAMPKAKAEVLVPADETGAVKTNAPVHNQAATQASPVRVQRSQTLDATANARPSLDGPLPTQTMAASASAKEPANATQNAGAYDRHSLGTPIAAYPAAPAPAEQPVVTELKETPAENRIPGPAITLTLPAPVLHATIVPAASPDVNVAAETSAADSDSTTATQQTTPVSTFAAAAAAPAPVAFSAVLTPVSDFSAATPSPLLSAAEETAPADLPFSFAAPFSGQTISIKPAAEENATSANAAKKTDAQTAAPPPKSREEQNKDNAAPVTPIDAAPQSEDFSRATQSAMMIAAEKPAAPETTRISSPAPAASDSAQAPEAPVAAPAATPSAPVQQIALRIPQAGGAPVDLQVTERGGEIHVSVRTADPAMQTSLREDLGTLSNSLERAGYRAEMYTPRETSAAPAAREMETSTNLRDERDPAGSGGRNGSGNPQQGRQQQSSRDQRQKNWLEELENSK